MINEITFCSIHSAAHAFDPMYPLSATRNAAIVIVDSNAVMPNLSYWNPVLPLKFDDYQPYALMKGHPLASDKYLRQKAEHLIKSGAKVLPNDRDAQKILLFADAIESAPVKYDLWIVCPTGYSRSASIARFLRNAPWTGGKQVRGLDAKDTDGHNKLLTGLLEHNYAEILKERHAGNANPQPTVRR